MMKRVLPILACALLSSISGCAKDGNGGDGGGGGEPCNHEMDRQNASCDGDRLIYCGTDNFWATVACGPYCVDYYGDSSVTGACGYSDEMRANNCLCVFPTPTCSHAPYCADSLWLTQCNADGTADEYVNCDDYCVGSGFSSGTCDVDACLCG